MKILQNPNEETYKKVTKAVIDNEGYCPCAIEKTPATECVCDTFRLQEHEGECHCGRFVKVKQ